MSVLMPRETYWLTNVWIARGFFNDALPFLSVAPTLEDNIKFCVDAELDTLDLRNANMPTMMEFQALVGKVVDHRRKILGSDFHSPEYFPIYMSKLEELERLVQEVLGVT